MAVLNKKVCVVAGGGNTGFGDCVLNFSTIVGAFLVPKGKRFTPAELEDFQTTLQNLAIAANPKDRIYPIHHFEGLTDNTEDKTVFTAPYGGKAVTNEGDYDWTFRFFQGAICLLKSLQEFNGSGWSYVFYDANQVIFGQKIGDDFAGITGMFHANKWKASDGSNPSDYSIQFVFKHWYINKNLGFVDVDGVFNPSNIDGLQDVVLSEGAGSARPALKILARTGCSNDDLFDTYATELAAVGAWEATINGAVVSITSVAEDPAISGWTITLDDTDPNYHATDPIVINLVDPVALDALGVSGFEGKKLTITD